MKPLMKWDRKWVIKWNFQKTFKDTELKLHLDSIYGKMVSNEPTEFEFIIQKKGYGKKMQEIITLIIYGAKFKIESEGW